MTHGDRALLAIRLSRMTDETTSPARQRNAAQMVADLRRLNVVGVAEDLDVSASKIPPKQRKGLGPWLRERADEYDVIIWARLDRAVRSMRDLAELAGWAKDNNKQLIFAAGPGGGEMVLDMTNAFSELIMMILAFAAQMESQANSERVSGAQAYLRQAGQWTGGMLPYWCRPVPVETSTGKGWILVHNPDTAVHVKEMVERAIDGTSMLRLAQDFEERGIPTPRDYWAIVQGQPKAKPRKWSSSTISTILKSRSLLGESVFDGQLLRDEEGVPIRKCPPLVTEEQWTALQAALAVRALPANRSMNPNMLLGVLYCANCGSQLYRQQFDKKGHTYVYLRCHGYMVQHNKCNERFRGETIEARVTAVFLATVGHLEVLRRQFHQSVDHSEELMTVTRLITDLEDEYDAGLVADRDRYLLRKSKLVARREGLMAQGSAPAGYSMVGSGQTYAQLWDTSSLVERRDLMRESKIVAYAGRSHALSALQVFSKDFPGAEAGAFTAVEFGPGDLDSKDLNVTMFWTGDMATRIKESQLTKVGAASQALTFTP